jgi:hypothetical protein
LNFTHIFGWTPGAKKYSVAFVSFVSTVSFRPDTLSLSAFCPQARNENCSIIIFSAAYSLTSVFESVGADPAPFGSAAFLFATVQKPRTSKTDGGPALPGFATEVADNPESIKITERSRYVTENKGSNIRENAHPVMCQKTIELTKVSHYLTERDQLS